MPGYTISDTIQDVVIGNSFETVVEILDPHGNFLCQVIGMDAADRLLLHLNRELNLK